MLCRCHFTGKPCPAAQAFSTQGRSEPLQTHDALELVTVPAICKADRLPEPHPASHSTFAARFALGAA
jgi:hypothetical protein